MLYILFYLTVFLIAYHQCYKKPSGIRYSVEKPNHERERYDKPKIKTEYDAFSIRIESELPTISKGSLEIAHDVKYFMCDNKNVVKIEPGAFTGQDIREAISLRMNQLTDLKPGTFVDMQIMEIHLDGNFITHIHERAFENLPNLEIVVLSHNDIVDLHHEAFINTQILHVLDLAYNKMKKISAESFTFMDVERDSVVKLEDNTIEEIDGRAFEHVVITDLNLKGNRLEKLPAGIFDDNTFERLFLDDNYIEELPEEFYEQKNLQEVHIMGNPLGCHVIGRLREMAKERKIEIFYDKDDC